MEELNPIIGNQFCSQFRLRFSIREEGIVTTKPREIFLPTSGKSCSFLQNSVRGFWRAIFFFFQTRRVHFENIEPPSEGTLGSDIFKTSEYRGVEPPSESTLRSDSDIFKTTEYREDVLPPWFARRY